MVHLFPFVDPTTNSYRIWAEGGRLRSRQVGQSWGDQDWDKEGMGAYNPVTKWEGLDPNSRSRGECLLWLLRGYACWFKRYWGQGCGKVSGAETRREKLLQHWRRKERNLLSLNPNQLMHLPTLFIHEIADSYYRAPTTSRSSLPRLLSWGVKTYRTQFLTQKKSKCQPFPSSEKVNPCWVIFLPFYMTNNDKASPFLFPLIYKSCCLFIFPLGLTFLFQGNESPALAS